MSKELSPSFQFFPRDFLGDENVMCMELDEIGAYWVLCCVCWGEQTVPSDKHRLGKILGVTPKRAEKLWATLSTLFSAPNDEGRCRHGRLDKEREAQASRRESAVRAGQKSAAVRRGASESTLNGEPTGRPTETQRAVSHPFNTSSSSSYLASAYTQRARVGSAPLDETEGVAAGEFFRWYQEEYQTVRRAKYVSTPNCWQTAEFLVATYDAEPELLQTIAATFLRIPDDADNGWLKGKTRTLGMLRSKASAIEERVRKSR